MTFHQTDFFAISSMAILTYFSRASGLLFADRIPLFGRSKAAFDAMPQALLTALIAPIVLTSGPAEAIAGLITIVAAARLPLLGTILVGVVTIMISREALNS